MLYSDARGQLPLFAMAREFGPGVDTVLLDCKSEDGSTSTTYPLELEHPVATAAKSVTVAAIETPPEAQILPALAGDPMAYSQRELTARGYPLRPDPNRSAEAYTKWLATVSHAVNLVNPEMVQHPKVFHGPAHVTSGGHGISNSITNQLTSNNWSGMVDNSSSFLYDGSYGKWSVPYSTWACPPYGNICLEGDSAYSSFWVGVDGWGSSDVVQDGTASDVFVHVHGVLFGQYYPWIEWYPNPEAAVSLTVHPGDQFECQVYVGDSSGNPNANGGTAWFWLHNITTSSVWSGSLAAPSGVTFMGNSGEWILEKPTVNGILPQLADYNGATDSDARSFDGTNWWDYSDDPSTFAVTMQQGSTVESSATAVSGSTVAVQFQWSNW